MNDLAFFLITLSVLGAIIGALAFKVGTWYGRGLGYDDGLKAGFLQGRRTERESGEAISLNSMSVRDIASRHHLRLALALSQEGRTVRLRLDREGYCVGFETVSQKALPVALLKMGGFPNPNGAN